ncbi:MAG: PQQ-binding-like beta-propeller repeat protein [Planctomycetota bacterium]
MPASFPFLIRATFAFLVLFTPSAFADWPQFRGVNSAGISAESSITVEFGPGKNELWSVDLAPGHSSPCIVGDSIFLTSFVAESKQLAVLCIDRGNGSQRWRRHVTVEKLEKGHPSFNPASSSPVSDGQRVVVYFGSYGLLCYDMQGDVLWERRMPLTRSYAGNATSPIITGDQVILYRGNLVDHFLLALDKHTGEERWKVEQSERFELELACTAVPIVHDGNLIVHSARSVQSFELETGAQIWEVKCATTATSTPVLAGDQVVVAAWNKLGEPALGPELPGFEKLVAEHDANADGKIGPKELPRLMIFHRPDGAEAPQNGAAVRFGSADKNRDGVIVAKEWKQRLEEVAGFRASYKTHGILSIPMKSSGLLASDQVTTLATRNIPEVPSPLYHEGYLYFVKNGGVLTVIDFEKSKVVSRMRTGGHGTHYASPIIVGDKLISTAGDGTISVLSLGPKPKLLQVNTMDDSTFATPAASNNVLYLRTHRKLYAFGTAAEK